jgi:hypothetical protein
MGPTQEAEEFIGLREHPWRSWRPVQLVRKAGLRFAETASARLAAQSAPE